MPDCSNLVIGDTAPACATQNTGDATTRLTRNGDAFNTALEVVNQNGGAIYGESTNAVGVFGSTDSSFRVGVSGEGGSGVVGFGRADAPDQPSPGVIGRGNQNGVIGEVDHSDGIGVTGYGGLNGAGVYGSSDEVGVFGYSNNGNGVLGQSRAGNAGVLGEHTRGGAGVDGSSVYGTGVRATGSRGVAATGRAGPGVEATGRNFGVRAVGSGGVDGRSAIGVEGTSYTGPGVLGNSSDFSDRYIASLIGRDGVFGVGSRNGVYGYASRVSGGNGVLGDAFTFRDGEAGVRGTNNRGTGVFGQTNITTDPRYTFAGVQGRSRFTNGVLGTSSVGRGVLGVGGPGPRPSDGVVGEVFGAGVGVRGVVRGRTPQTIIPGFGGSFSGEGWGLNPIPTGDRGGLLVEGHFFCVGGVKAAVVPHPDGSQRLLHSLECPESWFEDFGRAEITGGQAWVDLDPDFAAVVETEDYHVFLTPEGDSNGLYVSRRGLEGFEVREQQGGSNDLMFSYRVAARRKDGKTERLAKMEVPVEVPEEAPETREFSSEEIEEIEEIEQLIPSGEPPPEEPPPEPTRAEVEEIEQLIPSGEPPPEESSPEPTRAEVVAERLEEQRRWLREFTQQILEEQRPPEETP